MIHNKNNLILKRDLKFNKILSRNKVLSKKTEGMYIPLAWNESMNVLLSPSKGLSSTLSRQAHLKGKILSNRGGKKYPIQQSAAIYVTKPGYVVYFSTENFTCPPAWSVTDHVNSTMQPLGLSSNCINKKFQKQILITKSFFNKMIKRNRMIFIKNQLIEQPYPDSFWNQTFDKGRLKSFVLWFLLKHGEHKTVKLVEELKTLGFQFATKAGISLGVEDLKIPKKKNNLIMEAEQLSIKTIKQYKRNEITGVERFQRLIDTWHRTSEQLKQEVIENFEATDILNPVYMMAFSGARGNISQVRQLVGMRGLMSNPQGQIIDFPIRSNFREGLTLTEYIISSYGARKGIVDTALRTANAGYLTRRLVDVAQHVIISKFDCGSKRGIFLTDMKEGNKTIYSLQNRLVGRVLARDIFKASPCVAGPDQTGSLTRFSMTKNNQVGNFQKVKIAARNSEISSELATSLASICKKVFVRSSLTCQTKNLVCQLCYGWSLAQGNLVAIGEAVGVVAAQSIGEPGTQLTMRTFHTGGVFSGDVSDQIKAPFNGIVIYDAPIAGTLIRTPEGKIAFLTKNEGSFSVLVNDSNQVQILQNQLDSSSLRRSDRRSNVVTTSPSTMQVDSDVEKKNNNIKKFKIPFYTLLFFKNGEQVLEKEVIAQISSINRSKNATDQAEFTINAELSGQFFSKFLNLKENKVGPKLKSLIPLKNIKKNVDMMGSEYLTELSSLDLSGEHGSLVGGRSRKLDHAGGLPQKGIQPAAGNVPMPTTLQPGLDFNKQNQEFKSHTTEIFVEQFNENVVETIYEAWGWGYAWILSGKIYQLPVASTFFPILGDFLNNKSYMNKNVLSIPSTFGNLFKLSAPFNKKIFNKTLIKKMRNSSRVLQNLKSTTGKGVEKVSTNNITLKNIENVGMVSSNHAGTVNFKTSNKILDEQAAYIKKDLTILKTELISLQLSKIIYKKVGYLLKLTKPTNNKIKIGKMSLANDSEWSGRTMQDPRNTANNYNIKDNLFSSYKQFSIPKCLDLKLISYDDSLILLSSLNGYLSSCSTENFITNNIKKFCRDKNVNKFIYPTNWISFFDIFLNWFPKRLYTKTGGLIMLEPVLLKNLLEDHTFITDTDIVPQSGPVHWDNPVAAWSSLRGYMAPTAGDGLSSHAGGLPLWGSGHVLMPEHHNQVEEYFTQQDYLINSQNSTAETIFLNISDIKKSNFNFKKYIELKKVKNLLSLNFNKGLKDSWSSSSLSYIVNYSQKQDSYENNSYYLKYTPAASRALPAYPKGEDHAAGQSEEILINNVDNYQFQMIKFYPTFVKRWVLKNRFKKLNFKNSLAGKIDNHSILQGEKLPNDLLKTFIVDQFQTDELNSVIFQKQLHGLNKNKTKLELLTYGLNWKNNFKLNFNELSKSERTFHLDLITQKDYLNYIIPLEQKIKGYHKNQDIDLQRILFIPHFFYNFPKEFGYRSLSTKFNNYNNLIIQYSRQGKIKKCYLKEGFFSKYNFFDSKINHLDGISPYQKGFIFKEKLNKNISLSQSSIDEYAQKCSRMSLTTPIFSYSSNFPLSPQQHKMSSNYIFDRARNQPFFFSPRGEAKRMGVEEGHSSSSHLNGMPFSLINLQGFNSLSDTNFNSVLFLGNNFKANQIINSNKSNKTKIYMSCLNHSSLFNKTELKKRKKLFLNQLGFSESKIKSKDSTTQLNQAINSNFFSPINLKSFSKLSSFPYFLNKKSSSFINRETSKNLSSACSSFPAAGPILLQQQNRHKEALVGTNHAGTSLKDIQLHGRQRPCSQVRTIENVAKNIINNYRLKKTKQNFKRNFYNLNNPLKLINISSHLIKKKFKADIDSKILKSQKLSKQFKKKISKIDKMINKNSKFSLFNLYFYSFFNKNKNLDLQNVKKSNRYQSNYLLLNDFKRIKNKEVSNSINSKKEDNFINRLIKLLKLNYLKLIYLKDKLILLRLKNKQGNFKEADLANIIEFNSNRDEGKSTTFTINSFDLSFPLGSKREESSIEFAGTVSATADPVDINTSDYTSFPAAVKEALAAGNVPMPATLQLVTSDHAAGGKYCMNFLLKNFIKKIKIKNFNHILTLNSKLTRSIFYNYLKNQKINQICSPYLKNQFKFFFNLSSPRCKWPLDHVAGGQVHGFNKTLNIINTNKNVIKNLSKKYDNNLVEPSNFLNDNYLLDKKIYQTLNTNLTKIIYSENKKIKSNLYYKKGFFYIYFSIPNNHLSVNSEEYSMQVGGSDLHLKSRISYLKIWLLKCNIYKKLFFRLKNSKSIFNSPWTINTYKKLKQYKRQLKILEQKDLIKEKSFYPSPFEGGNLLNQTNFSNKNVLSTNIVIKPGWLYFTQNISNLFLYNKKIIYPGNSIGNHLIFDRDIVYLEMISLTSILKKTFKDKIENRTSFFNIKFSKIIKNNNCRFEPGSFKKYFIKQFIDCITIGWPPGWDESPSPAATDHVNSTMQLVNSRIAGRKTWSVHTTDSLQNESFQMYTPFMNNFSDAKKNIDKTLFKNSKNKIFIVLIRKANEYKLDKNIHYKKEISKIANGFKKYNVLYNSQSNLQSPIASLKNSFFYFYNSSKKWFHMPVTWDVPGNVLYPEGEDHVNSTMHPEWRKFNFSSIAGGVGFHPTLTGCIEWNARLGLSELSIKSKFYPNESFTRKTYSQIYLKKFNSTIDLFTQFNSPLLNKQKKSLQIISKYPSADFKIISNRSLYSSLLTFKNKKKLFALTSFLSEKKEAPAWSVPTSCRVAGDPAASASFPAAGKEVQAPIQTKEDSILSLNKELTYSTAIAKDIPFGEEQSTQQSLTDHSMKISKNLLSPQINSIQKNLKNKNLSVIKQYLYGINLPSISSIGPTNLSSFVISHQKPYSIDFPFKQPLHLFTKQYFSINKLKIYDKTLVNDNYQKLVKRKKNTIMVSKINQSVEGNVILSPGMNDQSKGYSTMQTQPDLFYFKNILNDLRIKNGACMVGTNHAGANSLKNYKIQSVEQNIDNLFNYSVNNFKIRSFLSSLFYSPVAEYSLGKNLDKSLLYPNILKITYSMQNETYNRVSKNNIYNNKIITRESKFSPNSLLRKLPILGSLNNFLDFNTKYKMNNEIFLYKTEFETFSNNQVYSLYPFINTYNFCSFEGELIFKSLKNTIFALDKTNQTKTNNKIIQNIEYKNLENALFANKRLIDSCIILTKTDQRAFYLEYSENIDKTSKKLDKIILKNSLSKSGKKSIKEVKKRVVPSKQALHFNLNNYKNIYLSLENLKKQNNYFINNTVIKFLNIIENQVSKEDKISKKVDESLTKNDNKIFDINLRNSNFSNDFINSFYKLNKLPIGTSQQKNKLLLGEFLIYGDQISLLRSITKSGQIIHINNNKITLRNGQPIFISPKAILHKYDTDFIEAQSPVITLAYQQLKTGDIIQGIPKVEQFFEARTTKRGRLFRDSLSNLLKGLFKRYCSRGQPLDQAVRQSFYKIQQIIVDGVQRVYRSQGVSIADKHLEVIVKQMTSKVRIIEGGQTGFFPGEVVDLSFVEQVNNLLMKKITYEPLVLGITKASLEVDSFLSAASFQQTTRVLSNSAISKKKDFLKGLKENVILGNLIPAGTGYLVYLGRHTE